MVVDKYPHVNATETNLLFIILLHSFRLPKAQGNIKGTFIHPSAATCL